MRETELSHKCNKEINQIKNSVFTCIVEYKGEVVFSSKDKGVKPLMDFIGLNASYSPITIKDKIIGKGAMVLAIKCQAHKVITPIISEKALALANQHALNVVYEKVVPYIMNRTGTGACPIESAVDRVDSIEEGYKVIISTLEQLRKGTENL